MSLLTLFAQAGVATRSARAIRTTGEEYRLSLTVTQADGRQIRWGPDEPDGRNIPQDLQLGSALPGGDRELRTSLFRELRRDNADNTLFDDVRVAGPGNEEAWRGRFAQFPRQHGDSFSVEPGAVGYIAELSDFPAFSEVYRDISLGSWGDPSLAYILAETTAGFRVSGAQNAGSAVLMSWGGPWSASGDTPLNAAVYDAGAGLDVEHIYYEFTMDDSADANERVFIHVSATDDFAATVHTGDLHAASGSGTYDPASPGRYALLLHYFDLAAYSGSASFNLYWRNLAVYGNHHLTLRGTEPDAGFYGSDVIADIVARCAPNLTAGEIQATTYPIPQLVFNQTTGADAIAKVNGFHLFEWGCFGRKFFWRAPDPDRLCWQARDCALKLEGETADELFNGVVVTYQDPGGKTRVAGPPAAYWPRGNALADATDASLVDTSETNVVNTHGIPRKWAKLELSDPSTEAAAIQLGAIFLAEKSQPQRRGELELRGLVQHPTIGKPQPVWKVKAGDWISIPDSATPEIKRRIIETHYAHETRSLTATLDNSAFRLDALLSQLGAGLTGTIS